MKKVILWNLYYFLETIHKHSNRYRIFLINFVVFHEHNTINFVLTPEKWKILIEKLWNIYHIPWTYN